MDRKTAKQIGKRVGIRELTFRDRVVSPLGEVLYKQLLITPGQKAFVFTMDGNAMGVLIARPGKSLLRYCDREGRMHEEALMADRPDQIMAMAMNRMTQVIGVFMNPSSQPLADAVSANQMPA